MAPPDTRTHCFSVNDMKPRLITAVAALGLVAACQSPEDSTTAAAASDEPPTSELESEPPAPPAPLGAPAEPMPPELEMPEMPPDPAAVAATPSAQPPVDPGVPPGAPPTDPFNIELPLGGLLVNHLIGNFFWAEPGDVEFMSAAFTQNLVTLQMADGTTVSFAADMTSSHPECGGVPTCVLLITPEGEATPLFFMSAGPGLMISRVECSVGRDERFTDWGAQREAITEQWDSDVVYETDMAICWNPRRTPLRLVPPWWTALDERDMRAQLDAGMEPTTPGREAAAPDPHASFDNRFVGHPGSRYDENGELIGIPVEVPPLPPGNIPPPGSLPPGVQLPINSGQ